MIFTHTTQRHTPFTFLQSLTTLCSLVKLCSLTGICSMLVGKNRFQHRVYTQLPSIMAQLEPLVDVQSMSVTSHHNFNLLKKLVLPDGSVLRAKLPGRPTRDCLFVDPARDGTSLLKVWNVNKFSGMVGVFNCQGAGWCRVTKKTRIHDVSPGTLSGSICADDVDLIGQVAGADWNGETVVYAHKSGELMRLPVGASLPVTLKVLDYELYHFCPLMEIATGVSFAPVGLLDMFNSTGALEQFNIHKDLDKLPELPEGVVSSDTPILLGENKSLAATVVLEVRGCGLFGAYSSQPPLTCTVDLEETSFNYNSEIGLLTLTIPVTQVEMYRWLVEIQF